MRGRGGVYWRAESKPGPPMHSLQECRAVGGAPTRGSQRSAWQPRARVCIPFRNVSAGCLECMGERGSWGGLGNSSSRPHRKRSSCRHHTRPDASPWTSSPLIDHNPCLLRWQGTRSGSPLSRQESLQRDKRCFLGVGSHAEPLVSPLAIDSFNHAATFRRDRPNHPTAF